MLKICAALIIGGAALAAQADTLYVPGDYDTIADAIDGASSGDTIQLAPMTYTEHSLDFGGKDLVIQGAVDSDDLPATTIDASQQGRHFLFDNAESSGSGLINLELINGLTTDDGAYWDNGGGAILIRGSAEPTLVNLTIRDCEAVGYGGAIMAYYGGGQVLQCRFEDNRSYALGGAIFAEYSPMVIMQCHFENNVAAADGWTVQTGGGALCLRGTSLYNISLCTFVDNRAHASQVVHGPDDIQLGPAATGYFWFCSFVTTWSAGDYASGESISGTGLGSVLLCSHCGYGATMPALWNAGGNCETTDCTDSDGDQWPDGCDGCPDNADRPLESSVCGCNSGSEDDSDGDGVIDCLDACPYDSSNTTDEDNCQCDAGDSDGDGTCDDLDECPDDPEKTEEGVCGCGEEDADTDGDGYWDCIDPCPAWPFECSDDGLTY